MSDRTSVAVHALATSTSTLLVVGAAYASCCAPGLFDSLRTVDGSLNDFSRVAIHLVPFGTLLLLALPGWILDVASTRWLERRRGAVAAIGVALALFVSLADQYLYRTFGRHLLGLLAYLDVPERAQATGSTVIWLGRAAGWSVVALVFAALFWWLSRRLERLLARGSGFVRGVAGLVVALVTGVLVTSPRWLVPILPPGFGPRLLGSLPFDPSGAHTEHRPGALGRLESVLEFEYRSRVGHLFAPPRPLERVALPAGKKLPSISLVVAESLRASVFTPELMPRLFAWSNDGLRFERHYAGSNHSESGLFNLVYGRSALTYHSTLNAHAEPTLLAALRRLGYRVGYFTGHPEHWLRREEFMNRRTVDDFERDDTGDWNDWDRRALARASAYVKSDRPSIAVTFLMSSHYEYRYPKEFERHVPADPPRVAWLADDSTPDEFVSNKNRYWNVAGFVDALVAEHVGSLDTSTTWVVFTGDHGEGTGENGRFGHGFDFSDELTRVPFVLRGPGVASDVRRDLTTHQDLVATLLNSLGHDVPPGGASRSLLQPSERGSLLLAYAEPGRRHADALLLVDTAHSDEAPRPAEQLRVRLGLELDDGTLTVAGFEDASGRAIAFEPSDANIEHLRRAFVTELESAGASPP